ncbi:MAG: succinylglutamate desuccinylase/aspartoacylase family protein, partial [Pseudomonadota bacterium]
GAGVTCIRSLFSTAWLAMSRGRGPTRVTTVAGPEYYIHAPCAGLFEPAFELGDTVEAGQLAGRIHFMDDPATPPREVRFRAGGFAICRRPILRVERGDCLGHLATDIAG